MTNRRLERVRARVREALESEEGLEYVVLLIERKSPATVYLDVLSATHCSACSAAFLEHARVAAESEHAATEPRCERETSSQASN